jgi:hypothetical protein
MSSTVILWKVGNKVDIPSRVSLITTNMEWISGFPSAKPHVYLWRLHVGTKCSLQLDMVPNTVSLTVSYCTEYWVLANLIWLRISRSRGRRSGGLGFTYRSGDWLFLTFPRGSSKSLQANSGIVLKWVHDRFCFFHILCNSVLPNHLTVSHHTVRVKEWCKYTINNTM